MDTQPSKLVFRDFPFFNWIAGLALFALGAFFFPGLAHGETLPLIFVLAGFLGGLVLLLTGSILTVTADRPTQTLTLAYRSLVKASRKEIPFHEIAAIELESSRSYSSRGGSSSTFRIAVVRQDGASIPFHSYYSSGMFWKNRRVEKLRAFIGVGGAEIGLIPSFKAVSRMSQQAFQQQQEAQTGSQAGQRVTDGVNWTVQTAAFGGTPVTRWFSPDFRTQNSFVYLVQKPEGQSSSFGGPLAGLGKMLYRKTLSLYGFPEEDTPGLETAEPVTSLDPRLEQAFVAFGSAPPEETRQILNPWVTGPLADWAACYPLKQFQAADRFSQLLVLFSPRGLYAATLGILSPAGLEEITRLGVELVKAQGSLSSQHA